MSLKVLAALGCVLSLSISGRPVLAQDADGDGLSDADEITLGTNPSVADDFDSDGISDFFEDDADGDGVADGDVADDKYDEYHHDHKKFSA